MGAGVAFVIFRKREPAGRSTREMARLPKAFSERSTWRRSSRSSTSVAILACAFPLPLRALVWTFPFGAWLSRDGDILVFWLVRCWEFDLKRLSI